MPGPGGLCCCMSSACPALSCRQAACTSHSCPGSCLATVSSCSRLCKSRPRSLVRCGCAAFSLMQMQADLSVVAWVALELMGLQEWAREGGDEQSQYVPARPVLALHFSRHFISVVRFSQAEFLTEINLFSPFPKTKGLISLKDFSSPVTAEHALTPSTPAWWIHTMPATLCNQKFFGRN